MKKTLVSVSVSALKLDFSSLHCVGARTPGRSAAGEGEELLVRVCFGEPLLCATREGLGEEVDVAFPQSSDARAGAYTLGQ